MKTLPSGTRLCQDMEDALRVIRRLYDPTTKMVVYDSETQGFDVRKDMIVGHVFSFSDNPSDTCYVPVRHHEQHHGNVSPHRPRHGHPFEALLNKVLSARRDLHLVGHNLQFDLEFLHSHGIDTIGTLEDTQVNAALLDEFARSYSLDSCCSRMHTTAKLGGDLYQHLARMFGGKAEKSQMANYWKLRGDDPMGVDYATGDGIATWSLRRAQVEDFEFQGMQRMHKLESDVTRVLYRMKKRGVRIDTEYLEYIKGYAEDKVAEGLKSLPEGFNARGPKQIKDLMTANGFTDWPMTAPSSKFPQGQPSFPEAWLDTNPVGKFIVNVRKWSNLLNSFIIPMRDRHIVNGRVHPTYHQMANDDFGTCTGRLSCSSPNLQQVPKRNKELAKLFRPIFIPDEGMEWLDADLSQCEPRLLAHYSGAKVLIDGFKAVPSVDAHEAVRLAVLDFGVQIDRESAKRVNQTLITGGGEGKIITMLGSRGKEIYDTYFEVMPEVKSFQRVAKERFRERKFLISLLGRRARLEFGSKDYLAMNRLLQCGNGDILKHSMVRIDALFEEDGDQCALLNNVHDSLSMQGAPEKRPVLMEALRIFTDYGPDRGTFLRVPMQADYGIGRNWGEATFPAEKASVG